MTSVSIAPPTLDVSAGYILAYRLFDVAFPYSFGWHGAPTGRPEPPDPPLPPGPACELEPPPPVVSSGGVLESLPQPRKGTIRAAVTKSDVRFMVITPNPFRSASEGGS